MSATASFARRTWRSRSRARLPESARMTRNRSPKPRLTSRDIAWRTSVSSSTVRMIGLAKGPLLSGFAAPRIRRVQDGHTDMATRQTRYRSFDRPGPGCHYHRCDHHWLRPTELCGARNHHTLGSGPENLRTVCVNHIDLPWRVQRGGNRDHAREFRRGSSSR